MQREIKFRIIYQNSVYGYVVNIGGEWWYSKDDNRWTKEELVYTHKDKTCELNQFTGLHDKNGKEIYESDKLKTNRGVGEVVWRDTGWLLKIEGHGLFSFQDIDNNLEIVGNKYEN